MQAGLLRDLIVFERDETTRDEFGAHVSRWGDVFEKRAYVRYNSGTRKEVNYEVINTFTHTFMIRLCKEVDTKMRISYAGQKFRIVSINHDRKQQSTTIIADVINE